jgi:hypothetical protein
MCSLTLPLAPAFCPPSVQCLPSNPSSSKSSVSDRGRAVCRAAPLSHVHASGSILTTPAPHPTLCRLWSGQVQLQAGSSGGRQPGTGVVGECGTSRRRAAQRPCRASATDGCSAPSAAGQNEFAFEFPCCLTPGTNQPALLVSCPVLEKPSRSNLYCLLAAAGGRGAVARAAGANQVWQCTQRECCSLCPWPPPLLPMFGRWVMWPAEVRHSMCGCCPAQQLPDCCAAVRHFLAGTFCCKNSCHSS